MEEKAGSFDKNKRALMQQVFPAAFNLSTLDGTNGFTIPGILPPIWPGRAMYPYGGELGVSISSAGDINGDGITDVVLGSEGDTSGLEASYVLFGGRSSFPAVFNLTTLNGSNGFTISGIVITNGGGYPSALALVSSAGDINGDGITDLVLGAPYANSGAGASYVLFGSRSGFPAVFNLTTLNGTNGFTIPGSSVSGAGDINGDTIADLVLGGYGCELCALWQSQWLPSDI